MRTTALAALLCAASLAGCAKLSPQYYRHQRLDQIIFRAEPEVIWRAAHEVVRAHGFTLGPLSHVPLLSDTFSAESNVEYRHDPALELLPDPGKRRYWQLKLWHKVGGYRVELHYFEKRGAFPKKRCRDDELKILEMVDPRRARQLRQELKQYKEQYKKKTALGRDRAGDLPLTSGTEYDLATTL